MGDFVRTWRHCTSSQDELTDSLVPVVNGEANRIPQLRCILPLVNQARFGTCKQGIDIKFRSFQVLVAGCRVGHVQDTLCVLLTCRCLAAPFCTLNQNSSHRRKFVVENAVSNSLSIICHNEKILSKICRWCQCVRWFFSCSFGDFSHLRSAVFPDKSFSCGSFMNTILSVLSDSLRFTVHSGIYDYQVGSAVGANVKGRQPVLWRRRYSPGVMPRSRLKARVRWLWS